MPKASQITATNTPKILLVGDGGTEKTRFLAGCPKPFIYDFDAGMLSAREFEDAEYETFKDAPWSPPKGARATPGVNKDLGIYPWGESWPRFINHLNEVMWPKIEKGELEWLTLGVDSLTTLANQCMNYVLRSSGKTGQAQPEIQHWGSQLRLLESVMEQLCAWPVRLVVTAHIKRDDNLVMGTKEFLPLVSGQLSGKIGVYFDECYYTEVKTAGGNRRVTLITQTNALYRQAKSRLNVPNGTEAKWSEVEKALGGKR